MLKLKLQYFGHLMQRAGSLEKTWCWERLKAGGEGDDRVWDGWMASLNQRTWFWSSSGRWWWIGKPSLLQFIVSKRVRHNWVTEKQVKNVAYSLKYTGSSILKPLPFKGIILFHSYRDKKFQNRKQHLSFGGFTGTLWPDLPGQQQEQKIPTQRGLQRPTTHLFLLA